MPAKKAVTKNTKAKSNTAKSAIAGSRKVKNKTFVLVVIAVFAVALGYLFVRLSRAATPTTYINAGKIPSTGMLMGASIYGGHYRASQAQFCPENGIQGGGSDDNGMGNDGRPLPGRTAFAELSTEGTRDFSALGKLPNGTKLEINYRGRTIVAEKADVGSGGYAVQGFPRAVDLWWETATLLNFTGGLDLVYIRPVDPSTPVTAVITQPKNACKSAPPPPANAGKS